ncbi:hypothetical protein Nepgr_001126 [Nepenthes gracilis]|uniref:Uncharacterized protein n=1 Tax=Nepenthes gracilis TaxID=150966 RepID=A0AAD3P807_NEPGR|nr:hypothetical protein Nepgr_001126 [Nepenthes gracilis]
MILCVDLVGLVFLCHCAWYEISFLHVGMIVIGHSRQILVCWLAGQYASICQFGRVRLVYFLLPEWSGWPICDSYRFAYRNGRTELHLTDMDGMDDWFARFDRSALISGVDALLAGLEGMLGC